MKPANKISYAYRRALPAIVVFSVAINMLMFALPIYSLQVFDKVISSGNLNTLLMLSIVAFGCFIAFGIINYSRAQIIGGVNSWIEKHVAPELLKNSIYNSCVGQKMAIGQHLTDLNNIKNFAANNAASFFFDLPFSLVFIFVIYLIHPYLCIIAVFGCVIIFAIAYLYDLLTKSVVERSSEVFRREKQISEETVLNAEAVTALGMIPAALRHWQKEHLQYLKAQDQIGQRSSSITSFLKVVRFTLQVFVVGTGISLVLANEMTMGGTIASSMLVSRAFAPFEASITSWKSFINAKKGFATISSTFSDMSLNEKTVQLPKPKGKLVLEDMGYAFPGQEKPVLHKVSFDLNPGEVLVIVGRNSAGKSTLAKILAGILRPSEGEVRLDGADIFDAVRGGWGRYIGYLPQRTQLFDKTVAENIARLEAKEINAEKVIATAKLVGIHDAILRLPQGYETNVGVEGSHLSTGLLRSVAVARAFYGRPGLLVLDEPNSNLDYHAEASLIKAIKLAKSKKITTVIVSHAKSLVSLSDKAVIMESGMVQMFGKTAEILQKINATKEVK